MKIYYGWVYGSATFNQASADYFDLESRWTGTGSVAAGTLMSNNWQIIDFGPIRLPPINISQSVTPDTLDIKVFPYWDSSGTGTVSLGSGTSSAIAWEVSNIFLLPIDEGVVVVDTVGSATGIFSDNHETNFVYLTTGTTTALGLGNFAGAPFPIGPEDTRVYVLREDNGDPLLVRSTLTMNYIPRVVST